MSDTSRAEIVSLVEEQEPNFHHWELIKDVIDQQIDIMLNYRQSGHPGGSRSKVHFLTSLLLSGAMRWDLRRPEKRFGDRFILVAGHTAPLVYAMLAVFNESLRFMLDRTGDERYRVPGGSARMMTWEDLATLRNRSGLPGHVEMEGKNLFVKFNTGPSGHGAPTLVGEALALKRAGAGEVKVFGIEGEGGHTAGVWHETKNSAYGLGLDNLNVILDWNDFGIDPHPVSSIVHGTPRSWFEPYGWHVHEAPDGSAWGDVTRALLEMTHGDNPQYRPGMTFGTTRKGRGYGKYDAASHGSPHKLNSEPFWQLRREFAEKYDVAFAGMDEPVPSTKQALTEQCLKNLDAAMSVLRHHEDTISYLADRLVEIGDSVPDSIKTFVLPEEKNPLDDPALFDVAHYPESMWVQPGDKQPNRAALARWGSWINSYCLEKYGRPLFVVCSADLAGSTNIIGFGEEYDGRKNTGWYDPRENPDGVVLKQGITEFANAGLCVGMGTVNMSREPEKRYNGFYSACSTYGSFSYLKYGAMRLYSQLVQDTQLKCGKVIWVAGHSGPETAEDSRTHFGVFSPGVTQLFPDGHVIDLHPWEYNEVPVLLAAALQQDAPIVALHLTRPGVEIPDRRKLGLASHLEAARGAYILRDYLPGEPKQGVIIVQGTMSTYNLLKALPRIDDAGVNVKLVAVPSPQLFRWQPDEYRNRVLTPGDRMNSTYVTNRARRLMRDWAFNALADDYALSSDRDDRWRPGGSVDEVCASAGIDPDSIAEGVIRFAQDFQTRMAKLKAMVDEAMG
ncbi:MAG: transketolase [Candidatus Krumholzibacteriia bacterium]